MSVLVSPTLVAHSWTRVPTLTIGHRVTIQPRGGAPCLVYIGSSAPTLDSPFFVLGENHDIRTFELDIGDGLWMRYASASLMGGPAMGSVNPVVQVRGL